MKADHKEALSPGWLLEGLHAGPVGRWAERRSPQLGAGRPRASVCVPERVKLISQTRDRAGPGAWPINKVACASQLSFC